MLNLVDRVKAPSVPVNWAGDHVQGFLFESAGEMVAEMARVMSDPEFAAIAANCRIEQKGESFIWFFPGYGFSDGSVHSHAGLVAKTLRDAGFSAIISPKGVVEVRLSQSVTVSEVYLVLDDMVDSGLVKLRQVDRFQVNVEIIE